MDGEDKGDIQEFCDMRMRELCEAQRKLLVADFDAKLAKLESTFMGQMEFIEAALAAMPQQQAPAAASPVAMAIQGLPGADQEGLAAARTLGPRMSMLEEGFARVCNLVGRLDQELAMLREELAGKAGK